MNGNNEGWIKVYRRMLDWEWMDDPYMVSFWLRLLMKVNQKDKRWHGRIIRRGQLLTSMRHLATMMGMDEKTVQRILKDLKGTGEITVESDRYGTLVTVTNFSKYQGDSVGTVPTMSPTPAPTPPPTPSPTLPPTNIRSKEEKEREERKNIVVVDSAHEEFELLYDTNTDSASVVMMRQGWNREDYLNAVKDFIATCKADRTTHKDPEDALNHFRNWTSRRYKYGEHPLSAGPKAQKEDPGVRHMRNLWDKMSPEKQEQYRKEHNGKASYEL